MLFLENLKEAKESGRVCGCGNMLYYVNLAPGFIDFTCSTCGETMRVLRLADEDDDLPDNGGSKDWTGCAC